MDNQWMPHGYSMECPWIIYGYSGHFVVEGGSGHFVVEGGSMDTPWILHGVAMNCQWIINGLSIKNRQLNYHYMANH